MDKLPSDNPGNSQLSISNSNPYSNATALNHITFCKNKESTITNKGKHLDPLRQQCICRLREFNRYNIKFRQNIKNMANRTRNIKSELPSSWNPTQPNNIKINVGTAQEKINAFLSIPRNNDCIDKLPSQGGRRKTRRRSHRTKSTRH